MVSHALFQGIFLTQELNPCLLQWQVGSLPLSPSGKPMCIDISNSQIKHVLYGNNYIRSVLTTQPQIWSAVVNQIPAIIYHSVYAIVAQKYKGCNLRQFKIISVDSFSYLKRAFCDTHNRLVGTLVKNDFAVKLVKSFPNICIVK